MGSHRVGHDCSELAAAAATACRILVSQPGIEPVPPAVEALSLNHWTTKQVPQGHFNADHAEARSSVCLLGRSLFQLLLCLSQVAPCDGKMPFTALNLHFLWSNFNRQENVSL